MKVRELIEILQRCDPDATAGVLEIQVDCTVCDRFEGVETSGIGATSEVMLLTESTRWVRNELVKKGALK